MKYLERYTNDLPLLIEIMSSLPKRLEKERTDLMIRACTVIRRSLSDIHTDQGRMLAASVIPRILEPICVTGVLDECMIEHILAACGNTEHKEKKVAADFNRAVEIEY